MISNIIAEQATAPGNAVQMHQLSAGTVQQERQPSGSGTFGWFAGSGVLLVVLLIVARFVRKPGSKPVARPSFTPKDRALMELLSEIVDIIQSVEK